MKNNEHCEQLWKSYEELENRILEIIDIIDEVTETNHNLSVYCREMNFHEDNIICGKYKFPFKWLSMDNSKIIDALNNKDKWKQEKENALRERELAELERLKEKYKDYKSCETCKWNGSWDIRCGYCEDFEHYERR